jgi:hypothetical protein
MPEITLGTASPKKQSTCCDLIMCFHKLPHRRTMADQGSILQGNCGNPDKCAICALLDTKAAKGSIPQGNCGNPDKCATSVLPNTLSQTQQ